jgi:hypothetical protein
MRLAHIIFTLALGLTLLPTGAWAQSNPVFAQPYQYLDPDGPGVMTFTPTSNQSTTYSFQQMEVTLTQGSQRMTGSGVYHSFTDDPGSPSPYTLFAFTIFDNTGTAYFFEGRVSPGGTGDARVSPTVGYSGGGTYWQVNYTPRRVSWTIQQDGSSGGTTVVTNSSPALHSYWQRNSASDAIGGFYYATYNTSSGTDSTATWSGSLPRPGNYRVEIYITSRPPNTIPRTNSANYFVTTSTARSAPLSLNQAVSSAQWLTLGTFSFGDRYEITLVDQTGEPTGTRSVVANAVRLTAQQ